MHGWLLEKVYGLEDVGDLLKWPFECGVLAAGMLLLAGLWFRHSGGPAAGRTTAYELFSANGRER